MNSCYIWIKSAKFMPWYKNMAFCLCTYNMKTSDKFTRDHKLKTWPINYSFYLLQKRTTHYILQLQLRGIIILICHKQWNISRIFHDFTKLHLKPPNFNGSAMVQAFEMHYPIRSFHHMPHLFFHFLHLHFVRC